MSDIKKDVETGLYFLQSLDTIEEIEDDYDYPFERTNEDLDLFIPKFPIKDGTIATVAGSGDQQLQIAKDKPKEIHVFDKNPFAIYMSKLKTSAMIALSCEEFIDYFSDSSPNHYNLESYTKIRKLLDRNSRTFWDMMYLQGNFERRYAYLIQQGDVCANIGKNSYENEKNYYKTKKNLKDIKIIYYNEELFKFFEKLPKTKRFNSIFLSNIYDWLPIKQKEVFADFIKSQVSKKVYKDGMIAVYSSPKNCYYETGLERYFRDTISLKNEDKVLTYKR